MSGHLAPALVLDRYSAHKTLESLAGIEDENQVADALWTRIHRTWQVRGMNNTVVLHLSPSELRLVKELGATTKPRLVEYKFVAIYRHPECTEEVRVRSAVKPPKRRTLRIPGSGRKKFTRVKLYKIIHKKESNMARKRTPKAAEVDELDELEGLEELEDLEDTEAEEPDEDAEEEAPKPRRKRSTKATPAKPARRSRKKVEEPEDEEDEDEEEDEEPEEKPARRTRSKKAAAAKPAAKSNSKSKGGPAAGRTTKELTGGVGTAELAEAASEIAEIDISGREVRIYLRRNEVPKDEDAGRYVWPSAKNKEFVKLAKAIAKEYAE